MENALSTIEDRPPSARTSPARGRVVWLAVVPVLLLAAWLGARGLNADALWYDEWLSVYYAGGGPYGPIAPDQIWARVAERSTWPPGFQTALAGWGALVGWQHAATRVFPFLMGVFAVAWMYRLGREMASHRVGLYAAFVLAASAFFANYLHELRGYTLYALFSAICVWGYWRIIHGTARAGTQVVFVLSVVGLLYTHYFATLTAVAVALYHLLLGIRLSLHRRQAASYPGIMRVRFSSPKSSPPDPLSMHGEGEGERSEMGVRSATRVTADSSLFTQHSALSTQSWLRVPLLMLIAAIFFLPWAGVALSTTADFFEDESRRIAAMTIPLTLETLAYTFSNGSVALLALVGVAAAGARGRAAGFAWFWLVSLLALSLLINERLQIVFHIRHLLALWCPLALVAALGIVQLARRGVRPIYVLAIWGVAGVWNAYNPDFINKLPPNPAPIIDWQGLSSALDVLEAYSGEDDRVLFHVITPGREWLTEPVIDFYADPLPPEHKQFEAIPGLEADDDYYRAAREYVEEAPLVWTAVVPDVPSPYQVDEFRRALAADFAYCGRLVTLPTMWLDLYSRPPDKNAPAPSRFGEGIGMRLLHPLLDPEDGSLTVLLGWTLDASVPRDTYSVALHVVDAAGNLVAQADYGLSSDAYSCQTAALDTRALPPGEYALMTAVYAWQTGERLAGAADGQTGDRLMVGTFSVG